MTLPEASAAIDVHNGNAVRDGRVRAQAAELRKAKQDRFLYDVCDRLHVTPAALTRVPFDRVLAVVKEKMNGKSLVEATVKAEVARFAADHAEPEAPSPLKAAAQSRMKLGAKGDQSPLKPTNPTR